MDGGMEHSITGLKDGELERFLEFFYRRTGITFPKTKLTLVERRILNVMSQLGYRSFRDGFLKLKTSHGGPEMQRMINALTINETYFYREQHHLELLVKSVLPEITAASRFSRSVRIWSVPCSTGEEPYSIGIYLLENWPGAEEYDIELVGSDIDTNALKAAGEAQYTARAVSRLPQSVVSRYFRTNVPGQQYALCRDVADAVSFSHINLLEQKDAAKIRNIDVVFCRNLLIYFDDASRRIAIEHIYESLKPGGYVFLGHAESMSRMSSLFEAKRHDNQILYRKPV